MKQDRLKQLFRYDEDTGHFIRLVNARRAKAGEKAGYIAKNGYVYISVDGKPQLAHRMAWLYVHGHMPKAFIDHINRNPADNRISNLRECTQFENMQNITKFKSNTSGVKGVYWAGGINKSAPWLVQVRAYGKLHYVGYFFTKEEAAEARIKAADKLHGTFARHD